MVARLYVELGDNGGGDAEGLYTGRAEAVDDGECGPPAAEVGESELTSSPSSESHTSLCK